MGIPLHQAARIGTYLLHKPNNKFSIRLAFYHH
jgi:hypothetical protein